MKADFNKAFRKTNGHEGGYVNHAKDRGKETYKGISRRFYPNWLGWPIIDAYKRQFSTVSELNKALSQNNDLQKLVIDFYHKEFWLKGKLDNFDHRIAEELYDTGVNQGLGTAIKHFQKALNKLNRNAQDYPDITVDGGIGGQSVGAYGAYMATQRFGSRSEELLIGWLVKWMNYYQLERYADITDEDPEQEIFIPGWTNRA
jgi:lysozyme family protein